MCVLCRHSARGFRAPWLGQVEAHATFTLALVKDDLGRLTEGSDVLAQAENWPVKVGAAVRATEADALRLPSASTMPPEGQKEGRGSGGKHALLSPTTEDEAWELVARKVL